MQYFSQQGVSRLAARAGFGFPVDMPAAEQLVGVQQAMQTGDPRAEQVYDSLGICFGYAVAHYADFYKIRHLLVLGRVTSGAGGELILRRAVEVLEREFPEIAARIRVGVPAEQDKRHGQAIAAASLPALRKTPAPAHLSTADLK